MVGVSESLDVTIGLYTLRYSRIIAEPLDIESRLAMRFYTPNIEKPAIEKKDEKMNMACRRIGIKKTDLLAEGRINL